MGVLSEGEGGRGVPGVDSGLWMPFSQPGGERDRERKREKEGSKLGSAQLKRTSRLRLVAVLKKASAASNWVQVSSSIVLFASEGKGEREGGRAGRGAGGWGLFAEGAGRGPWRVGFRADAGAAGAAGVRVRRHGVSCRQPAVYDGGRWRCLRRVSSPAAPTARRRC
jgi:hypothetical protein